MVDVGSSKDDEPSASTDDPTPFYKNYGDIIEACDNCTEVNMICPDCTQAINQRITHEFCE